MMAFLPLVDVAERRQGGRYEHFVEMAAVHQAAAATSPALPGPQRRQRTGRPGRAGEAAAVGSAPALTSARRRAPPRAGALRSCDQPTWTQTSSSEPWNWSLSWPTPLPPRLSG